MNEQALEAQGVAVLGVRRKMLKTFEVIRRKMIRRPRRTAPPPSDTVVADWWRCLDARTGLVRSLSAWPMARADHYPSQEITAARRKPKVSTQQYWKTSRYGSTRSDCTSTHRTLRVCPRRKWCLWMLKQALEAQGAAAHGARRKMLKTFEVIRRKMGIDNLTVTPLVRPRRRRRLLLEVRLVAVLVVGCRWRE